MTENGKVDIEPTQPSIEPTLQDLCKLYLLANVHEFPLDLLAKLPTLIRHKLWLALSLCDRLHYEDTAFVNGFDEVKILNSPLYYERSHVLFPTETSDIINFFIV